MINSENIHFVSFKKKQQLRIKGHIGSFICNSRATGEEENKLLLDMKFKKCFPWLYDPSGVITETKLRNKNSPYAHVPKREIKKFMNQTEWEENTLKNTDKHLPSTNISLTNTPQEPTEKRPKKEASPSVTKVLTDDFQVYRKRPKTSHTPDRSGGEETHSTTVMEGAHSPFSSRI
jgi:hypothetical protein